MARIVLWLLLGATLINPQAFGNPKEIRVGGYLFEPFLSTKGVAPKGLTADLIALFNQHQTKYHFKLVLTSPKRRYMDFERHLFDVMFFESIHWGWENKSVVASKVFLNGGEVYIALQKKGRTQQFFDRLNEKSISGILGYHYGFANFVSDESILKKRFQISLVNSPKTVINQVLAEKVEIGVITESFLNKELMSNTDMGKKLLVSEKYDQVYHHTILLRKNLVDLDIEAINRLLNSMESNGALGALFKKYGLAHDKGR